MTAVNIPEQLACRMVLHAQKLEKQPSVIKTRNRTFEIIDTLGYIQIDTIHVVERAHHHILWTRQPGYETDMVRLLQKEDRLVFEYWTHAMSYVPISDYRYYLPRMHHFSDPQSAWGKMMVQKAGRMLGPVLERIRQEGPLGSDDFKSANGEKAGTWWDWKPAKAALELLFWRGELMVSERVGFKKKYDLTERVLPDSVETDYPDADELGRFLVRRALRAQRIATMKEILRFLQPGSNRDADFQIAGKATVEQTISDLIETHEVTEVVLEGNAEERNFILSEYLDPFDFPDLGDPPILILSPFDNLIIQRERTARIFGFDYALECYLPAQKRKYGYFVHPILYGDRFVGRIDPKADRKNQTFFVNALHFEPGFQPDDRFMDTLASKLDEMARFNGCRNVVLQKSILRKIREQVEPKLKAG